MKPIKTVLIACSVVAIFTAIPFASAQDAVVNGGFESGTLAPDWTTTDLDFTGIGNSMTLANSGTHYVYLGADPDPATLTQTLVTTPGTAYNLSFWLANDAVGPASLFQVVFDGNVLTTLTDSSNFAYTLFSFPNLVATTSSTQLQFVYRNQQDFFRLDDVSATTVVPEPSSLFLVLLALAGLALVRRRRVMRFGSLI